MNKNVHRYHKKREGGCVARLESSCSELLLTGNDAVIEGYYVRRSLVPGYRNLAWLN